MKKYLLLMLLFSSLELRAQVQIAAAGPTDICFGYVTLNVVSPQAGFDYNWFAAVGTCGSAPQLTYSHTSTIDVYATGEFYCVETSPGGVVSTSNIISVRVLPGSFGSVLLPLPYTASQVICQPSINLCIPPQFYAPFPTTIKWYRNNTEIVGANSGTYTASVGGVYKYSITSSCITAFSDSVDYVTATSAPAYTTTSVSPVCNGNYVDFAVVNPVPGAVYTWQTSQFSGSGFFASGQGTTFHYQVPSQLNLYVRLQRVITGCGLALSPETAFTVQNISRSISPFSTQTLCPGSSVNFTSFTQGGVQSIQWMLNNTPISGATSAAYTATTPGTYSINVTAACGVASSNTVSVQAGTAPASNITAMGTTTFCSGGSVTLQANTGTGLTYQWKKYGNLISGATASSYNATTTGNYKCVVSGPGGCTAASNAVFVTVNPLPAAAITAGGPVSFCAGDSVVLTANSGAGLTYQWKKYSNLLPGATSVSYTVKQAGKYKCIVTNANGCSRASNAITVTVPCREIAETAESDEPILFPNPSDGQFAIHAGFTDFEKTQIRIYSLDGRLVTGYETAASEDGMVVNGLSSGWYFVEFTNAGTSYMLKAVVQ